MAKHARHYLGNGIAIQLRGEVWSLDVYRQGKRFRRSLGTQDEVEALMVANSLKKELQIREELLELCSFFAGVPDLKQREKIWNTLLEKGIWTGPITPSKNPNIKNPNIAILQDLALEGIRTEDLMRRVFREEINAPGCSIFTPWAKALKNFGTSKTRSVVSDSLDNIMRDVRAFIAFAKTPNVQDTTSNVIDQWISDLLAKGDEPKTAKNKRGSLSIFFTWATRVAKIIEKNPVLDTDPPKVDREDPEYLTREQALKGMERIAGHPTEWIAGLSLYSGIRLGELHRLNKDRDVDIPGRNIRVRKTKKGSKSQGQQRNVPILDQALPYAVMMPREGFPDKIKKVSTAMNKLGVGNLLLRHTLETHLRLNGVVPDAVGDLWLGHSARTGGEYYKGWWKPSESPLTLTFFGLPLVKYGVPEIPPNIRASYNS